MERGTVEGGKHTSQRGRVEDNSLPVGVNSGSDIPLPLLGEVVVLGIHFRKPSSVEVFDGVV